MFVYFFVHCGADVQYRHSTVGAFAVQYAGHWHIVMVGMRTHIELR